MVVTWITSLLFDRGSKSGDDMPPSLPGTSVTREALPATPSSRKRTSSFNRESRPSTASKAARRGVQPAKPTLKSVPLGNGDEASQVMDETSEMMDNVVHYSEGADDEEPCTSASILQTPSQSSARPKPYKRWTGGREMSAESDDSQLSGVVGSPKRKIFYTINDLHTNRPAERFRTDILNQIRAGDSEFMPYSDESTSCAPAVLRLTDRWREEWNHGVQVPLHPKNLPRFETKPCDIPSNSKEAWRLPRGKYLLSQSVPYEKEDTHVVYAPPPLRIYQGDRLDELWLEKLNREHTTNRLPALDMTTFLNLMNEFEIECYKTIHRRVLDKLASPTSAYNATDKVDEDAPCDVCQITVELTEEDRMIFCDGCNICVHIHCYGLDKVPPGTYWECDMCKAVGFTRHDRLKCALCPNIGGAMKQVEGVDIWVHFSCALWIPELTFTHNKAGREIIQSLAQILDSRYQLKCSICDLRHGACIQCAHKGCAIAFHTTCAQRSKLCDVLHETNERDEPLNYHAFCKRHTLMRKREREGPSSVHKDTVDQSDDETDERSEILRGFERAFFLYAHFEEVAKKLNSHGITVSQLHASDVYEYWKLKRSENGGRPLIACPHLEIEVDTDTPIVTIESAQGEDDGQIMLRASDDVQHQLTPFQLKCWRFQKHVHQTADKGRLACDLIIKRERKKLDIVLTSREFFSRLVDLDNHTGGVPMSGRVLNSIIDSLQQTMTPEEIAETDRMAEEMIQCVPSPNKKERAQSVAKKARGERSVSVKRKSTGDLPSTSHNDLPSTSTAHQSPSKENGNLKMPKIEPGVELEVQIPDESPVLMRTSRKGAINRRTVTFDNTPSSASSATRASTQPPPPLPPVTVVRTTTPTPRARSPSKANTITPSRRLSLRPQNPPDDLPAPSPTVSSVGTSPTKLRERREVKYF